MLAGRYRLVVCLGKGGMGEVYRADDLMLGQAVALKFLPAHLTSDPDRLRRFRKEVASARRVSHPNVCRVYDIAEHDGQPFLTMEFVDGEDLSSLLKRVGRLPEEKGTEVARQLCAALAAVHDQHLLHRDLKPANVMLDGRGKVRLTDFGLAASAAELRTAEVTAGTPPYQSPEQLAGKEVTARSDLFALGLVLYELFTGKRAYPGKDRSTSPSRPSSHVSALSPALESVILNCLETDPANRPRSAYEVLAALPGVDPLVAALAAGETPSPQLVVDAGEVGLIRPWVGAVLFAVVALGLAAIAVGNDFATDYRAVQPAIPPDEMARIARQRLAEIGAPDLAAPHEWFEYHRDGHALSWVLKSDRRQELWAGLPDGQPAVLYFLYRRTPTPVVDLPGDPAAKSPGMTAAKLDVKGRLIDFYTIPSQRDMGPPPNSPGEPDWAALLRAAGLAPAALADRDAAGRPISPEWAPPGACDCRSAWVGTVPDRPDLPIRVEAAGWQGRPVFFRVVGEWTVAERERGLTSSLLLMVILIAGSILLGGGLIARNVWLGRADWRAAGRLAILVLAAGLGAWVFRGPHPRGALEWFSQFSIALSLSAGAGALAGAMYLALEPILRRRWPWRITSWNRLLAGRVFDPLVGRDVLAGLATGALCVAVATLAVAGARAIGLGAPPINAGPDDGPFALPPAAALLLATHWLLMVPLVHFVMALVLQLILRKAWLSWTAYAGLWVLAVGVAIIRTWGATPGAVVLILLWAAVFQAAIVFLMVRFGLLSYVWLWVAWVPGLDLFVLTWDPSAWDFGYGLTVAAVVLVLAGYAFYTSTGGARLFKEGLFGD
jgi:serine/threonine-protein kinase